jgi:hypothetical protein
MLDASAGELTPKDAGTLLYSVRAGANREESCIIKVRAAQKANREGALSGADCAMQQVLI